MCYKKDILDKGSAMSIHMEISACMVRKYNHFGVSMTPI